MGKIIFQFWFRWNRILILKIGFRFCRIQNKNFKMRFWLIRTGIEFLNHVPVPGFYVPVVDQLINNTANTLFLHALYQYVLAFVVKQGNWYVESFVLYNCSVHVSQLSQAWLGWVVANICYESIFCQI